MNLRPRIIFRRAIVFLVAILYSSCGHQYAGSHAQVNRLGAAGRQTVLRYLNGISGNKTVVGVVNKNNMTPTSDTDRITAITGQASSFWGADFGFTKDAIGARSMIVSEAVKQWNAGAIVGLMYHACPPTLEEPCNLDDIVGSAQAHLTDVQWNEIVSPGTPLYDTWIERLDGLSVYFQELRAAGVVVLFRPFHEMNQCAFWWGCHDGSNGTAKLYRITYDYLMNTKGLDNIVWVWSVQDFPTLAVDVDKYNPGVSYFDIAALDFYGDDGYTPEKYQTMLRVAVGKPIAIGECKNMPTPDVLIAQSHWVYAALWPDFIDQNRAPLAALFKAANVVTLSQMPGWR